LALLTKKELLFYAGKGRYALAAFDINNLEFRQAVVSAGESEKSPAIIAVPEGAIQYAGLHPIVSMLRRPGREAIKQTVHSKMRGFTSSGKAH
jgi:fructose-bisphosphate aldolase, class II